MPHTHIKTLVIYHGGCTDGVAAAWAVWRGLRKTHALTFYPGAHQQPPPLELVRANDYTIFVDFSYKHDFMVDVVNAASRPVDILDHHRSAIDDLRPITEIGAWGSMSILDESRCGAMLAFHAFNDGALEPELLRYIDARDRFAKDEFWPDDMDYVIMALRSYPHSAVGEDYDGLFRIWNDLMSRQGIALLRSDGAAIYRYYRARVEEAKAHMTPWTLVWPDGEVKRCRLANSIYAVASDAGQEALKDSSEPICGVYWIDAEDGSITFSLRSNNGEARLAAEAFGGGGHPNAAGFKVPFAQVDFNRREIATRRTPRP